MERQKWQRVAKVKSVWHVTNSWHAAPEVPIELTDLCSFLCINGEAHGKIVQKCFAVDSMNDEDISSNEKLFPYS